MRGGSQIINRVNKRRCFSFLSSSLLFLLAPPLASVDYDSDEEGEGEIGEKEACSPPSLPFSFLRSHLGLTSRKSRQSVLV